MKLGEKFFFCKSKPACQDGGEKKKTITQKKTNLMKKDGGEERQEEYPTYVPLYYQMCGTDVRHSL